MEPPSQNAALLDLPPPSNLNVSPDTSSTPSPPADCNASLHGGDIVQPSAKEDLRHTDSNASVETVETGLTLGGLTDHNVSLHSGDCSGNVIQTSEKENILQFHTSRFMSQSCLMSRLNQIPGSNPNSGDLDFPAPSAVFGGAESDSQFYSNRKPLNFYPLLYSESEQDPFTIPAGNNQLDLNSVGVNGGGNTYRGGCWSIQATSTESHVPCRIRIYQWWKR
jgi:hypothetical protein